MQSPAPPDHAGLAILAQTRGPGLRLALLRFHAHNFARAAFRTRDQIASFEALATGFVPLVSDDVVAEISGLLRDVADVPAPLISMLSSRLERDVASSPPSTDITDPVGLAGSRGLTAVAVAELLSLDRPDVDAALADNDSLVMDGAPLAELLRRARSSEQLTAAMLARPEPSAADRAGLFRFADLKLRDRIRADLAIGLVGAQDVEVPDGAVDHDALEKLAADGDFAAMLAPIGKALKIRRKLAWTLDRPVDAELFALSLVALGFDLESCLRIFLTVDRALSRSVKLVFRLAEICRSTSPEMAAYLVRRAMATPPAARPRPEAPAVPKARRARAKKTVAVTPPDPEPQDQAAPARAGRRSRSTKGRGRS